MRSSTGSSMRSSRLFFSCMLGGLLAVTGVALAQPAPASPPASASGDPVSGGRLARARQMHEQLEQRFKAADVNADGRVSRDEAKAAMPMVYRNFDQIDVAHAGSVSMGDIEAYAMQRRRAQRSAQ